MKKTSMDQTLERLGKIKELISDLEKEKKDIEGYLNSFLDKKAVPQKVTLRFPLKTSEEDISAHLAKLYPHGYSVLAREPQGSDIVLFVTPDSRNISSSFSFGDKTVSRTCYSQGDTLDFDGLRAEYPDLFDTIVKSQTIVEHSIDRKSLNKVYKDSPDLADKIRHFFIPGSLRTRLSVKENKDG